MSGDSPRSLTPPEERYIVRVQLVYVSDKEGEYISQSFDYEVSPTTETYQEPLFLRAERLYKQLQSILGRAGKVTVTDRDKMKAEGDRLKEKAEKYDLISNNYFEVSNDGTTWNTTNLSKVIEAIERLEAVKTLFNELPESTVSHLCSVLYPIKQLSGMDVYTNHTLYAEFKKNLEDH